MPSSASNPPSARAGFSRPVRSAATAVPATVEKPIRHHAPIDIGERGLKIRSMLKKRSGRPRSRISSGAPGITAPSASLRATAADLWSPATSHASPISDEPPAIPPSQKYSGTSQVQTGGLHHRPLDVDVDVLGPAHGARGAATAPSSPAPSSGSACRGPNR